MKIRHYIYTAIFTIILMTVLFPAHAFAEPLKFVKGTEECYVVEDPNSNSAIAEWELNKKPRGISIFRYLNTDGTKKEKIYDFDTSELDKTAYSYELPISNMKYEIEVYGIDPEDKTIVSAFYVRRVIKTVQAFNLGSPDPEEEYVAGEYSDMVPYGCGYRVSRLSWLRFSMKNDGEGVTVLKPGDHYTFLPNRKYKLKVELTVTDSAKMFKKPEKGKDITTVFNDIIINGQYDLIDKVNSYVDNANRLILVTDFMSTEECYFTHLPEPVVTTAMDSDYEMIDWGTNFVPVKTIVYKGDTPYQQSSRQRELSARITQDHFGKEIRIRSYYTDEDYIESKPFKVCRLIESIEINGFRPPEDGELSTEANELSVPENCHYSVEKILWRIDDIVHDEQVTFTRPLGQINAIFKLKSDDGYVFDLDSFRKTLINGRDDIAKKTCYYDNHGQTYGLYSKEYSLKALRTVALKGGEGNPAYESNKTVEDLEYFSFPEPDFEATVPEKVFLYWKEFGVETTDVYAPGNKIRISKNMTFSAVWGNNPQLVTIEFKAGEFAEGNSFTRQYPVGRLLYLGNDEFQTLKIKDGYRFSHWAVVKTNGNEIRPVATNPIIQVASDISSVELVGQELEYVKVSFDANGGSGEMPTPFVYTAKGKAYTLPECSFTAPDKKEFACWIISLADDQSVEVYGKPGQIIVFDAAMILKPWWEVKPVYHTISFDPNGGSGTMESFSVNELSYFNIPECAFTPPAGQEFDKWLLSDKTYAVPNTKYLAETDLVIKALWKDKGKAEEVKSGKYKISFFANGGSGTMNDISAERGQELIIPGCSFTPPENTIFSRWKLSDNTYKKPGEKITVTGNLELCALWLDINTGKEDPEKEPKYCKVTFDPNGGAGEMESLIVMSGTDMDVPSCGFTPPEKKLFDKWKLSDGTFKNPGDKLTIKEDTVLSAVWNYGDLLNETFTAETKNTDGSDIIISVTYSKALSYNGLKHVLKGSKKKKGTVDDMTVDVVTAITDFADPVVKLKNNKDANIKNKANKQPYYTISFKVKKGKGNKGTKRIIKSLNRELKKKKISFTINQADIGLASDVKYTVKKGKVKKISVTLDGRTLKLNKKDCVAVVNPDGTVTLTASGERSNFIGSKTK